MVKIKCPYCTDVFDYSKEEMEWVPIVRFSSTASEASREKYVVSCKHCGKKIEFWM
jgi:DNA-directed RNA polymerase subunit RPC12/RpoP